LGKAAAEAAEVPCGFIFNECAQDDWTRTAVTAGFNLVMPADASASYVEYRCRVGELAKYAHAHGVAIEAELGELPSGVDRASPHASEMTDPELARAFVDSTGVDLLAVSVGNIHVALAGRTELDLNRLRAIRRLVDVPLILHGGTGIADYSLRQAIAIGVTKVNYGTGLKQSYLAAVRRALSSDEQNPHVLLGLGGSQDVMMAGRQAVRDAVIERLPALGCAGRA
jgi:fructose-bisphosphate aldolase class II